MKTNSISKANKEILRSALQRYDEAKREIERQRENEIRLENERREREKRERELRVQQSREAFKRGFISLAKIVLPIAVCYGLYVYSQNLNVRNVQAFVENTLIFVSLTAFFANVHLSNDLRHFTHVYYPSRKGEIFNVLAELVFYISIPLIFISPFVALIIGGFTIYGLIEDGFATALGDSAFWKLVGTALAGIDFMIWAGLCLPKLGDKTKLSIDGGGATADWVALVSTAVLMLYAYSPIYFAIAD